MPLFKNQTKAPAARRRGELWPISVAPMMDRTDRHFRSFLRFITKKSLLYTEMITTGAIRNGDVPQHLAHDKAEHPLALQLGGDDPQELAICAKLGEEWGYQEINLNVGCPSSRVQHRNFGACLMATPELVRDAVLAMRESTILPVTVKHRIGIDDQDQYEHLRDFVVTVSDSNCDRFIVHARKAILTGLSPKQNRQVPPLRYDMVHRLKKELPDLAIEINGGFLTGAEIEGQLESKLVDGVMIGRAAYDNPFLFHDLDRRFLGGHEEPASRFEVLSRMIDYCTSWMEKGVPLAHTTRSLIGFFCGIPGARRWRQTLNERLFRAEATRDDLEKLLELVPKDTSE